MTKPKTASISTAHPEGKKLIYAEANPNVWGQAVLDFGVTEECDYAYTSVHFSGKLCSNY